MQHAGSHEQAHPVLLLRTHRFQHAVVVIDAVFGRNELVNPTMPEKQLAASGLKGFQVGIQGCYMFVLFVAQGCVAGEIEIAPIPVRIFMDEVPEMVERR